MKAGNVLMVCLGNICRSPLAHGIFQTLAENLNIQVDSAGTANYHSGNAPDPRSIAVAAKNGIDISSQKARQFIAEDFSKFEHIFVMDKSNLQQVLKLAKTENDRQKVRLLLEDREVEDPYYGGQDGFTTVFNKIEKGCEAILTQWKK